MKKNMLRKVGKIALIVTIAILSGQSVFAADHPAYLKALSDLRAARWLIYNRPGNWQQNADEAAAQRAIEDAIHEIMRASIDDHKDINEHPAVQEIPDRAGRIQKAIELLRATRNDVNQREDDMYAQGLKRRALQHIDEALSACERAVAAGHQGAHPAYLQALTDLRFARWLIYNRPGNWQQNADEAAARRAIEDAINEITRASVDDGKNINDHPQVQEIPDRAGRIQKAMELLQATRGDVNQREDDGFAQGLKARALQHIDQALAACQRAVAAGGMGAHPAYLKALSDLRVARWLIYNRPGNSWQQSADESAAVRAIEDAIREITRASIDDHKDINEHPAAQEIPDRGGRLRKAIEELRNTRADVNQREDDGFAQGLKARALQHIDEAIRLTDRAIQMSR